jgi:hypothetical protein
MRLVLHATEVIEDKTYTTKKFTVNAKNCRTPQDAESLIIRLLIFADDYFARLREGLKSGR